MPRKSREQKLLDEGLELCEGAEAIVVRICEFEGLLPQGLRVLGVGAQGLDDRHEVEKII